MEKSPAWKPSPVQEWICLKCKLACLGGKLESENNLGWKEPLDIIWCNPQEVNGSSVLWKEGSGSSDLPVPWACTGFIKTEFYTGVFFAVTQVTSKVVSLIKSSLGQCLWTQGPISTGWLHLGVFLFSLISTFSTVFHFPLHFLSHAGFIMMCSAIKAYCWLWHSVSQVTVAVALLSRKRLGSPQKWELVKKNSLSEVCRFAFLNQWSLSWSTILLISCFSYCPADLET